MSDRGQTSGSQGRGGILGIGIAALAIVCCAAFPLLAALAGSVAVGTILGAGAGILAGVALVAVVASRARRTPERKR